VSDRSYTSGMKTAVSIPDELFREAEQFARRTRKSRSKLYQDALREYLARHDDDAITEAWNRLADEVDTRPDAFSREASRRAFARTEW
jgi:metal-responsive CopG/Arc/MetJ family transcriptional regulator